MKPWKGVRRFTITGIGQPSTLAVGGTKPTHVVLPVRFDRGTALLMTPQAGAQEMAKRLLDALATPVSGEAGAANVSTDAVIEEAKSEGEGEGV